jgi:UDP-glucose 6-dehydrogenase
MADSSVANAAKESAQAEFSHGLQEFIALGSVVRDLLHPDMVLIGECDSKAGEMLEKAYI